MRAPSRAVRRAAVRSAVVTVVMTGAIYLIWRHFGGGEVAAPVSLSAGPVLLALAGCALFIVGRAWRLSVLLGGRVGFRDLVSATGLSWGAGLLLPGPSADATFVVLAKRRFGVGFTRGTGVSVLARGLDLVSLGVIAVLVAPLSPVKEPLAPILAVAACGLVGALGLGLLAYSHSRAAIVRLVSRVRPLRRLVVDAAEGIDEVSSPRPMALLVASTALCRVASLAEYAALFSLCGVHLDIWGIWVVLVVRTVLSTIPIQGLAGLGTSQVWWAGGLGLEGIAASSVVGVSVTISLLDIAVSIPVVAACWLVGRLPIGDAEEAYVSAAGSPRFGPPEPADSDVRDVAAVDLAV